MLIYCPECGRGIDLSDLDDYEVDEYGDVTVRVEEPIKINRHEYKQKIIKRISIIIEVEDDSKGIKNGK